MISEQHASNPAVQIITVPFDLGASRRGTDGGPAFLRRAGLGDKLRKQGYEVLSEHDITVPDLDESQSLDENVRFKNEILQVCEDLADETRDALNANQFPLVIGGDHSIAMGTVSGVSSFYRERDENIGLIWFDAHGDMNIPGTSTTGNIHGMPLAHILGMGDQDLAEIHGFRGKVKAENVALVGIRDIDYDERKLIHESGIKTFTMRDIDEVGMASVCREAIETVTRNTAGFHLSFDVDACDPSVIPGSGTLVHGGVSFREAHLLMECCADSGKMLSMEAVEFNPFLDQSNVSAERIVALIESAMGRSIL